MDNLEQSEEENPTEKQIPYKDLGGIQIATHTCTSTIAPLLKLEMHGNNATYFSNSDCREHHSVSHIR